MDNVMIDLETLGRRPGCSILSIGAVMFDPESRELGREFYVVVNRKSCADAGLHEDEETLRWWDEQNPSARSVLNEAENGLLLLSALGQLALFIRQSCSLDQVKVWGNGSDFDNAILACAYAAINFELPWKFWNNRCYRTMKSMVPEVKIARLHGIHHNALYDAKNQAAHLLRILSHAKRR